MKFTNSELTTLIGDQWFFINPESESVYRKTFEIFITEDVTLFFDVLVTSVFYPAKPIEEDGRIRYECEPPTRNIMIEDVGFLLDGDDVLTNKNRIYLENWINDRVLES